MGVRKEVTYIGALNLKPGYEMKCNINNSQNFISKPIAFLPSLLWWSNLYIFPAPWRTSAFATRAPWWGRGRGLWPRSWRPCTWASQRAEWGNRQFCRTRSWHKNMILWQGFEISLTRHKYKEDKRISNDLVFIELFNKDYWLCRKLIAWSGQ